MMRAVGQSEPGDAIRAYSSGPDLAWTSAEKILFEGPDGFNYLPLRLPNRVQSKSDLCRLRLRDVGRR